MMRYWIGVLMACCGLGVGAQVPYFDGLSVQLGTGYQRHGPAFWDYKTSGSANGSSTDTGITQGVPLAVSATYTWVVSDHVSLGLSYERNLTKTSAARQSLYSGGAYLSGGTIRFNNQSQWSIVPGVLIDPSTMLYAKVGLAKAHSEATSDGGSAAQNFDFSGRGIGIGIKGFVTPRHFSFAEYNRVVMSDTLRVNGADTFQTSSKGSVLLIGMGWQF